MNTKMKKILSLLLVFLMLFTAMPVTTFAANAVCSIAGHKYEWEVITPATCASKGVETYACTRSGCDAISGTREVEKIDHKDYNNDYICDNCKETLLLEKGYCGVDATYTLDCYGKLVVNGNGAIKDEAFYNDDRIKTVVIENGITKIGIDAFASCDNIVDLDISESVKNIGELAFYSCKLLTRVFLPEGVEVIDNQAFIYCENLNCISIPSTLTEIGISAIRYCKNLENVYYAGTEKQWNLINIDESNISLNNSIIHFEHEHNFSPAKGTPATCVAEGETWYLCEECNYDYMVKLPKIEHEEISINAVEATCIKDGLTAGKKCGVCASILEGCETIPATGHKEVVFKPAQAPTCKAVGYTESKHCSVCKTVTVPAEGIAKIDHTYGEWTVTKTATCATAGVEETTCTVCKEKQLRTIDRLPHTEKETKAVDATCTTDGSTAGIDCTVCSAKVKEVEVIKALGHDYVEDKTVSKAATCTEAGFYKGKCSRCNDIKEETLEVLGHFYHIDTKKSKDATCVDDGTFYATCVRCDEVRDETILALGHKAREWRANKGSTCTSDGEMIANCLRCEAHLTRVIESYGHEFDVETVLPTCTEKGKEVQKCIHCGAVTEKELGAIGHEWRVTEVEIEPTCEFEGKMVIRCFNCWEIKEEYSLAIIPHTYQPEWQTIIAPTCTKTGTAIKICKGCFDIQTSTLPAVSHTDSDGDYKCDMCSLDMTPAEPEVPADPSGDCDCNCHKDGIAGFFFKFILFFQRLFGKNKECDCGAEHY